MTHRLLFTLIASLLLVTTLSSADEPAKLTAERVKLVLQMYEKLPCEILGFIEPSKKIKVLFAQDGGSIGIFLVDTKDKQLLIRLDRNLETKARDSLCLSTKDGELRLPARDPEESAVYGLLVRLPKADRERVGVVLEVLDQRFAGAIPTADKGKDK
jgi:hypothetical protein